MNSKFSHWFDTFLDEKNLPHTAWEFSASNGTTHFIDTNVVIEMIRNTNSDEQRKTKYIIVQIDFHNGDVIHFFRHLAEGIVHQYQEKAETL